MTAYLKESVKLHNTLQGKIGIPKEANVSSKKNLLRDYSHEVAEPVNYICWINPFIVN